MMIEKPYSVCGKFRNNWEKTIRSESYCSPYRTSYNTVMRGLRRKYEPPDDHGCDICGKFEEQLTDMFGSNDLMWSKWRLDHYNMSKRFRGFLCHNYNFGLGYFQDDPETLKKAISYLIGDKLWTNLWGYLGVAPNLWWHNIWQKCQSLKYHWMY